MASAILTALDVFREDPSLDPIGHYYFDDLIVDVDTDALAAALVEAGFQPPPPPQCACTLSPDRFDGKARGVIPCAYHAANGPPHFDL